MGDAVNGQELPAVDGSTLARHLGVTPKQIYDLVKAGIIERGAGRTFALEDSVRRYCEWLRGQLMAASTPYNARAGVRMAGSVSVSIGQKSNELDSPRNNADLNGPPNGNFT
jgi:hypothetical protein